MSIKQAYILCGGLGTRLKEMTKEIPKPMLPLDGKPILQHTVEFLKAHGFERILLIAGYKADVVEEFFTGLDWGVDIQVHRESELVGTAGYMPNIKEDLDDDFLLLYGDVFIDYDIDAHIRDHERNDAIVTFLSGPSTHPWDSNLLAADGETVTGFIGKEKEGPYQNIGDKAVYMVNKRILTYIPEGKSDFMKDVFPAALNAGETLHIHQMGSGDFVRDMGRPERFRIVENYLKNREEIRKAKENPQPVRTVFLDRDGVLNKEVHLLSRPDQLEMLEGVPEAIRLLNTHGIRSVVVTNQPVIARGLCTQSTLDLIHAKLERELETKGARLDAIYCCPHHPETQHLEGVRELRRGCDCRKPGIGMILAAKEEMGIDLAGAVMIGDSWRDMEAGKNAGLRTIFIDSGAGAVKDGMEYDHRFTSLNDAARAIIGGKI